MWAPKNSASYWERAREWLPEEDYQKLKAAVDTLEYLTELVADKDTTIRHLRQLLLPAGTGEDQGSARQGGAVPARRPPRQPRVQRSRSPIRNRDTDATAR